MNGWIFPIGQCGEASWWRVCYQRGLPRLVFMGPDHIVAKEKSCCTTQMMQAQAMDYIGILGNKPNRA